jgi:DNA-binding MarR family transcriptional regulator
MKMKLDEIVDGLLALQQHGKIIGRDLSPIDLIGLSLLRRSPGMILSAVADKRDTSAAAVTGMMDKLEKLGLAERRSHPEDRRKKQLFLTPSGEEVAAHLEALSSP